MNEAEREAKDYLYEIRDIRRELRICRAQASECHISYSSLRAIDYSKDNVQSSPKNALEEAAWRMLEEEERYTKRITDLTLSLNEHLSAIRQVKPKKYADLLYLTFYENKDYETIATENDMKISYIKKMRSQAVKAFSLTEYRKKHPSD